MRFYNKDIRTRFFNRGKRVSRKKKGGGGGGKEVEEKGKKENMVNNNTINIRVNLFHI